MAGRVMTPGCQADMVPILTGAQGQGKTRGVRAMVPEDTFRELSFHQDEDARARLMRGALMVELGELSGLRSREIETIKAWITRSKEDWVPKYQEYAVTLQRRCVIQGTSNPTDLLDDPTGARRWLPMACGEVDVEGIARDRDQLWAEALVLFTAGGVEWREAQALAEGVHDDYRVTDTWEEVIERWLETPDLDGTLPGADGFSTHDVLTQALCFREHAVKRADEMRAAKVLKALGFRNKVQKDGGKAVRRWSRG
jgi:predicted P-loop ATPase